jgi:hypothetical protein
MALLQKNVMRRYEAEMGNLEPLAAMLIINGG